MFACAFDIVDDDIGTVAKESLVSLEYAILESTEKFPLCTDHVDTPSEDVPSAPFALLNVSTKVVVDVVVELDADE